LVFAEKTCIGHKPTDIIVVIIIIFIYHTRTVNKIQKLNSTNKSINCLPEKLQLIDVTAYTNQTKLFKMNNNVNAFKARLDKFWKHQSVKFDFTADLAGTGNRSEEVIK